MTVCASVRTRAFSWAVYQVSPSGTGGHPVRDGLDVVADAGEASTAVGCTTWPRVTWDSTSWTERARMVRGIGRPAGVTGGHSASITASGSVGPVVHRLVSEFLGVDHVPPRQPVPAADEQHPVHPGQHRSTGQVRLPVRYVPVQQRVGLAVAQRLPDRQSLPVIRCSTRMTRHSGWLASDAWTSWVSASCGTPR